MLRNRFLAAVFPAMAWLPKIDNGRNRTFWSFGFTKVKKGNAPALRYVYLPLVTSRVEETTR
jgi:hypothetical protein